MISLGICPELEIVHEIFSEGGVAHLSPLVSEIVEGIEDVVPLRTHIVCTDE